MLITVESTEKPPGGKTDPALRWGLAACNLWYKFLKLVAEWGAGTADGIVGFPGSSAGKESGLLW